MSKKQEYYHTLPALLAEYLASGDASALRGYLQANSGLPGPRGNLELAEAFAELLRNQAKGEASGPWALCTTLSELSPAQAPVNTPGEYLSFCGTVGIGAVASASPQFREPAMIRLRVLARDSRWRMREAVAMALQRLLAEDARAIMRHLFGWVEAGEPLELRAATAGVAEPRLLKDREQALEALKLHTQILTQVHRYADRSSPGFRVLRQGLGYTLSVVVSAAPDEGFAYMAGLAETEDRDLRWILSQNLKKNRLIKHYPGQVEWLTARLAPQP